MCGHKPRAYAAEDAALEVQPQVDSEEELRGEEVG